MRVSDVPGEAAIPSRLRRLLAAAWISLGLHAALIAWVQVAPPASTLAADSVIEARLVQAHPASPVETAPPREPEADRPDDMPDAVPRLAPSEAAEPLPLADPVPEPPAPPAPAAAQPAEPAPEPPPPAAAVAPAAPPPVAVITSSVDLTYYSARELDMQPRALREIVPDYPPDADRQRLSGKVRLQLKLEADGRVGDIEVVSATPPGRFEDSAIRAFRDARFAPAQKNGRPVRAQVVIEVVYDWAGRR